MKPVLDSGLTKCAVQICAADGFRAASDKNGAAVKQQIIRYMKENLGNAGIEALLKKTEEEKQVLEEQEKHKKQWNGGNKSGRNNAYAGNFRDQ